MRVCQAFYLFFAMSLISSIIQEHECKPDSIDHMALKSLNNRILRENAKILPSFSQLIMDVITLRYQSGYQFYCMALYHSQMQRHVINILKMHLTVLFWLSQSRDTCKNILCIPRGCIPLIQDLWTAVLTI